ncbi:MAG: hypothetical protein M3Y39_09150 [Chloroflexota bacterium]|nr:hypothetical protein [Chloroflexota bacterium]
MTFLIIMVALIIVLDIVALRWGTDSREDIDGAEWKRRVNWALSHPMHHD